MKRNETSARGASKHAPVKNAGSRRLRSLTAAAFIVMTGIGLAWHTGWGTLSSFGIGSIAEVCPLGALEAMLADRTFLPQAFFGLLVVAAVVVLFGRIFCGWVPEGLDPRGGNTPWTDARCTKCRACADACPTHAIHFPAFERKAAARAASSAGEGAVAVKVLLPPRVPEKAIPVEARRTTFAETVEGLSLREAMQEASRCLRCGECVAACPLGNPIPDMMALMAEGRAAEAGRLLVRSGAAPDICGRICPQERLCEGACSLGRSGAPVAIGAVERAAADAALARGAHLERRRPNRKASVAVVGAGPAGLACADMLARLGATVTVIDAHEEAGGLLAHGIPAFKLDGNVLEKRLSVLGKAGVAFRLGTRFDGRIVDEVLARHDAVFVATGAPPCRGFRNSEIFCNFSYCNTFLYFQPF